VNLRNGTLGAYLRELRDAGYVTDTSREVTILGPGLQRIGLSSPRTAPPSTDDLVALYAPKLKAGERRLLDVLVRAYPESVEKQQLSEQADVNIRNGTLGAYLRALKRFGLVETQQREASASATLFLQKTK